MSKLNQAHRIFSASFKHQLTIRSALSDTLASVNRSTLYPRTLPQLSALRPQFKKGYSSAAEATIEENGDSSDSLSLSVENLQLSPLLKSCLTKRGIKELFSIQVECFPHIVDGKDLVGRARTGTGKTLAFSLPVIEKLQRLKNSDRSKPQVLILAPTRELANQVNKEISQLGGSVYRTVCVYGGSPYLPQENALRRGVDIVVGTPGRVQDMINKGALKLSNINTLILDEADHMLDIGFSQDLDNIIKDLRAQRTSGPQGDFQFLLFSATVPDWIKKAISKYLKKDHVYIDHVGNSAMKTNQSITQLAIATLPAQTAKTLEALLQTYRSPQGRCIVFCETKQACDSLAIELGRVKGVNAMALHGDVSQASRERALERFRQGAITCLIATDVAARGLDINNVELVVQTTLPKNTETFIHRSGRTGRAGKTGTCITLFHPNERSGLDEIRSKAGADFKFVPIPKTSDLSKNIAKDFAKSLAEVSSSQIARAKAQLEPSLSTFCPDLLKSSSDALSAVFHTLHSKLDTTCPPRSMIDAAEGFVTMQVLGVTRSSDLCDILYKTYSLEPLDLNPRQMSPRKDSSGLVFDVSAASVDDIMRAQTQKPNSDLEFSIVRELPTLQRSYDQLRSNYRVNKRQTFGTAVLTNRYTRAGMSSPRTYSRESPDGFTSWHVNRDGSGNNTRSSKSNAGFKDRFSSKTSRGGSGNSRY